MENYLALLKEYLNINFILQVKAAYQKNIFKGYILHQNRYVPQEFRNLCSSPPGINLRNSVFNKKHFLKFGNVLEH